PSGAIGQIFAAPDVDDLVHIADLGGEEPDEVAEMLLSAPAAPLFRRARETRAACRAAARTSGDRRSWRASIFRVDFVTSFRRSQPLRQRWTRRLNQRIKAALRY